MTSVELINIEKHYGGFHALKDVNLTIEEGELLAGLRRGSGELQAEARDGRIRRRCLEAGHEQPLEQPG